jgi:sulfide:quinone oxidoreductase
MSSDRSSLDPPFASRTPRVLVAGGGIAAMETVVALRKLAGDRVEIELLAPNDELIYRPLLVAEPFGVGTAHRFPLAEILADRGVGHHRGALVSVQPGMREVTTDSGQRLPYDALVVAIGVRALPALDGVLTFAGPADVHPLRDLVERARRGEVRRLVFTLPDQLPLWPLPLYELALMTASAADGAAVALATPEHAPLELFGTPASDAVRARLAHAGIELLTDASPTAVSGGALRLSDGRSLEADAVVALPRLEAPLLPVLPQGEGGFLEVDDYCHVVGVADVYAAGDVTNFRIKQGGFAARQADAVAAAIAARAGAPVEPEPLRPLLQGRLLGGGDASYLEAGAGASPAPLWWPPSKITSSYLVPYLVSRYQLSLSWQEAGPVGDIVAQVFAAEHVPARRPSRTADARST